MGIEEGLVVVEDVGGLLVGRPSVHGACRSETLDFLDVVLEEVSQLLGSITDLRIVEERGQVYDSIAGDILREGRAVDVRHSRGSPRNDVLGELDGQVVQRALIGEIDLDVRVFAHEGLDHRLQERQVLGSGPGPEGDFDWLLLHEHFLDGLLDFG